MRSRNEEPVPVAVITGAAQGIGRRTAEVLGERGYDLALIDLQPQTDTVAHLRDRGRDVLEFVGSVADERAVQEFADAVQSRWREVDVVVNNAGIACIQPAENTSAEQFRRVIDINLTAPFLIAKAFGKMMLLQGFGSIVNIASIAGLAGVADRAAYNASKHGLIGLTRTLAAEWGGRGVRCNAVCPGWVKTPMDDESQAEGAYSDHDITGRVPMGRFASPDDIAQAIAFLADPQLSGFVNGHTLVVDGGWTADASWQNLRLSKR
jgi:NAD(P)-dependent dehydrogenase (short-subunit alcohol dehydrogenase family)